MMVSAENDSRRGGVIWALDLDGSTPQVTPRLAANFSQLGHEALPAVRAALGQQTSDEIKRRLASGRKAYAAWVDGKLATYGWVSFEEEYVGELNLRVHLLPGEAYIWDCATLPDYRRNHLYSALLGYITAELRAAGLCRAWIGADRDNLASQRGIAHAGFRAVAELLIARVLALRQAWVQGLPGVPEELVTAARRVYLDNRDQVWLAALASSGLPRR